jgi:hypothetical protein
MSPRTLAVLLLVVATLASCGGSSASGVPSPSVAPVTTPEGAMAAVIAHEPRLTGIGPLDRDLIGQASWYEIVPASGVGAFLVEVRVGWGDCPAGCMSEHRWTYAVQPDGSVVVQAETGEPVPPEAWPSPGGDGRTGLFISATAGPTCPVEQVPPDPACAPKPVPGALIVVKDGSGTTVASVTLDAAGTAFVELKAGGYVVEPGAVSGLMGTPPATAATVVAGVGTPVVLAYDTGIR